MRVLLDLECAAFHGTAERVQRTDAGIARPGEDELLRAARGDHLVVNEVGRQPAQRQIAAPLPNDLVPGGERDEMGEALDDDDVAVAHVARDGVPQRHDS